MSVTLSPNTVPANAPYGTIIGELTDTRFDAVSFTLLFVSNNYFGIEDTNKLISLWPDSPPPPPKQYRLYVFARGSGLFDLDIASMMVTVTPAVDRPVSQDINLTNAWAQRNPHPPTKPGP